MAQRRFARAIAAFPKPAEEAREAALEPVTLDASTPLRLDGSDGGWLVQSGRVDLFAVALQEGEPAGMRHPLCQISAGNLIAGFDAGGANHTIVAVGRLGTSVSAMTRDQIDAWPLDTRAELIERWISLVAPAVFGDAPAWPKTTAEPGAHIELAAGERIFAPREPVWVAPRRGMLTVGDGFSDVMRAVPICAGLSLRAENDCAFDCVTTATAVAGGGAALEPFQAVILAAVGALIVNAEETARERIVARSQGSRRSIEAGLRTLSELGRGRSAETEATVSTDPIIGAFAKAVGYLGGELTRTPRAVNAAESGLRSLARANGIGLRTVLLRGEWWRRDNGPLLAWHGEPRRPVALLPHGPRRYRLWDPADGKTVDVDETVAREIDSSAVMTYRPMPLAVHGVYALIQFALRGVGREMATIIAIAAASGGLAALFPVATGYLFESAVPRAERGQVLAVVIGLGLAALASGIFDLTKAIALLRLEARLETALQPGLMHRLLSLPVNFYRTLGTGELTNRVMSIQTMRSLLAGSTLVSLLSAIFATSSFLVIVLISPFLALVSAGLVGVGAAVWVALSIAELRQARARTALRGQEDGLVIQIIQGITKIRVSASEPRVFAVWGRLFARQKQRFLSGQRYASVEEVFNDVYPILAVLVLLFAASTLLSSGPGGAAPGLGLGSFLSVNAAFGQLLAATTALARAVATGLELIPLFERLRPIVTAEVETHGEKTEAPPLSGRVDVSHVHFRYVRGAPPVLDDVSLRIEAGSFVAFVGPSGSGKSTLLRLLLGFETPERGDILYDGQSLTTLDMTSVRRQIGVVLQHGHITTGSILENITSGLPYSLDDAWAAARLAGIDREIDELPMGMHTLLIEGSATLSGGQRQRLMIARALVGKPRVLFFDEATSALDNRSQALVTESLEKLRTTRIVVAHRLSTIERADRIFVLEDSRLVESGTYPELMAQQGLFYRLAQRQIA